MAIKSIKTWNNPTKTDARIYVATSDGREGCYYITGNNWHAKKSYDGQLTEAEWQEAREIAVWDRKWHTIYENEMNARYADHADNEENVLAQSYIGTGFDSSAAMMESGAV